MFMLETNRKLGGKLEERMVDAGSSPVWLRHRRVTRSNLRPWYALPMTEDVLEPVPPLSKALWALPFGLLAAFAWTDWVLWPAILLGVMIVFAFRRNARTLRYAAYSSIYAAVLVFAIPPWQGFWFLERLQMFFVALLLTHLVGLAFDGARDGSFWAWLAPLTVFALQPSAFGLIAVFGLALLGALEQRHKRLGEWSQSRAGLLVLAVVSGSVLVLILPLPKVGSFPNSPTSGPPTRTETIKPEPDAQTSAASTTIKKREPSSLMLPDVLAVFNRSYMVIQVAMLTVLVCVIIIVLRFRSKDRAESSRWEDVLPLVAAAILGLAILIYGAYAPSGSAASESSRNQSGNGFSRQVNSSDSGKSSGETPASGADNPWPTVVFALVTAAAIAWVMLRNSRLYVDQEKVIAPSEISLEPEAATNRVREAYRAFLNLCARNGLNRLESETPLEFAQRLSEMHPVAVQPATVLTTLYEPVRYGGLSDLTGARAAEQALMALRGLLQPQTNPKDGTHD
jgi:Domain of unknown function (DUF4129)